MKFLLNIVLLIISSLVACGCVSQSNSRCKPVLFPYSEYGYRAEPANLSGTYTHDNTKQTVAFSGIKLDLPKEWRFKQSSNWVLKFSMKDGRSFVLFYKKETPFTDDIANFHLVGCDSFIKPKNPPPIKSPRDFIKDLYLFTDEDLKGEPTFWKYFILWSKTEILHDADKLVYYKGKNIEAFQMNTNPRKLCAHSDIACRIRIFPHIIAPNSLTIASGFTDDAFFADFLDMIDTLNP